MSDCLSLYNKVNYIIKINLCIVFYKQKMNTKILIKIIVIDLTNSIKLLFGSITYDELLNYSNLIKSIEKNKKITTNENEKLNKIQKELQHKSGAIKLNRKIDKEHFITF